jgi:anti-anti-sigma regulatory factor
MASATARGERASSFRLPPDMRVATASALYAQLAEPMAPRGAWQFDGSAVAQIDTAGVQLLLAVSREAAQRGIRFSLNPLSPELADSLRAASVNDLG